MTKTMFGNRWGLYGVAAAALSMQLVAPGPAAACGGFFCSQSAPVNQAAERIIFADDGDGNVTAIIQIMYEGPSESFSWLLPISSVPAEGDIGVASDAAFDRLQAATNPQYTLTTRVEGTCKSGASASASGGDNSADFAEGGDAPTAEEGGVTVEASGQVGPFEWAVISFDASLPDPVDAATRWLEDNGYDVGEGAPGLLRPYLEEGLNLLALRLTKGVDAGSIRPIRLTYPAKRPMIPIKLTAVAANDNMGVMAWLLSKARAVPQNYASLELNEARINWFSPSSNYGSVVNKAADEAGGQGFVTEYANKASTLADSVWSQGDEADWNDFRSATYPSFEKMFEESYWRYASIDGFWDAIRASVTLPQGVIFEDFQLCPTCYTTEVEVSPSSFVKALERDVIDPLRSVQELIDSHRYVTRLYSTMSAMDMTVDPVFTFNPDLEPVSNTHTAERVIECSRDVYEWDAPWRIELPQGGIVRGTPNDVGSWPVDFDNQPSNARILRMSESGQGKVLENNLEAIGKMLGDYNDTVPVAASRGGCSATPGDARSSAVSVLLVGLLALWTRRRRCAGR